MLLSSNVPLLVKVKWEATLETDLTIERYGTKANCRCMYNVIGVNSLGNYYLAYALITVVFSAKYSPFLMIKLIFPDQLEV